MKRTEILKGSIMKEKNDKRQNYEENKDTKKQYFKKYYKQKKNQKKYYNKKYYRVQRVKNYCDDKCNNELAQKNNNCSMISTKKNYL